MHTRCARHMVEVGYPGIRITFAFMGCPNCRVRRPPRRSGASCSCLQCGLRDVSAVTHGCWLSRWPFSLLPPPSPSSFHPSPSSLVRRWLL
jgi:hypothetical protein